MKIYHSSPIFNSEVSSHIIDGIIPVNIDSDMLINLRINDIDFLSQCGLRINVDFNKWKEAVFDFKTSTIHREMKGTILSSLQVEDIFFYDSEYQCFSIKEEAVNTNIENIVEKWTKRLKENLKIIENRLTQRSQESDKEITVSVDKNALVFDNNLYQLKIKQKNEFYKTIEQYINEYIQDSITFLDKRKPIGFELSLEEFNKRFRKLINQKEISTKHILGFLEWTCFALNIEVEAD